MCLAIPGKILEISEKEGLRTGRVDFGGIVTSVCLDFVPEAVTGDFVIVHVGFAISRLDEKEAQQVFEYARQIGELEQLNDPLAAGSAPGR